MSHNKQGEGVVDCIYTVTCGGPKHLLGYNNYIIKIMQYNYNCIFLVRP